MTDTMERTTDTMNVSDPVSVSAQALARLFHNASHAVSTDETRPPLCGVRLHDEGGVLKATATDSHMLYRDQTTCGGRDHLDIVVGDAKTLRTAAKTLIVEGDRETYLIVDGSALLVKVGDSPVAVLQVREGKYPDVDSILVGERTPTATDLIAINPAFMARIAKMRNGAGSLAAGEGGFAVAWTLGGPDKPMFGRFLDGNRKTAWCLDDALIVLMPVRMNEATKARLDGYRTAK